MAKLREAEVELSKGKTTGAVCRKRGITKQTHDRWREEYGGLCLDQAERFTELEQETAQPGQLVGEQALYNAILREAAKGRF